MAAGDRLPWSAERAPRLPMRFDAPSAEIKRATALEDPRIGHLVGLDVSQDRWPSVAIVGFPCDEGVRRNGGRVGAREAPDRVREWLYRLTPRQDLKFVRLLARMHDFGNLPVTDHLDLAQKRLGEAVAACLAQGVTPVIVGGGHETAFGHFLGYAGSGRRVSIVNWDAHPDVRPLLEGRAHSGTPFRQVLEHESNACAGYTVAGLLPHAVAAAHLGFLAEKKASAIWRDDVTRERIAGVYEQTAGDVFVSFDLDAVDQAFAPGVSAPATGGLTPELWLEAAYQAGRSPRVTSIDLVEVSPKLDRDDQTSRLAALTIWHFLRGFAERP
jgi:formiminoglutamase